MITQDAERIAVEQFIAARTEEELKRFEAVKAREVQQTVRPQSSGLETRMIPNCKNPFLPT